MENEFVWTDALVKEFAEVYRFSSSRTGIEQFKKLKGIPKEKDYEVIEMVSENRLSTYDDGNKMTYSDSHTWVKYFLAANVGWKIHSVKRLSDGEVFTIGDEVIWNLPEREGEKPFVLTSFEINEMWKTQKRMFCNDRNIDICYLKKVKERKPLFTTNDGKEIFEGDKYWWVDTEFVVDTIDNACETSGAGGNGRNTYFSTEQRAKEYQLMNKPIDISYQELMNRLHAYFINPKMASENLRELAKKKLNQ